MSTAMGPDSGRREDGFRLRIAGGSGAPERARRELARLEPEVKTPMFEDMRLLVSELVSNSVRHGAAQTLELTVEVSPSWVRVEVANPGEHFEAAAAPRGAGSGWGLFLVERLSHAWGATDDDGCQRVWFELPRA